MVYLVFKIDIYKDYREKIFVFVTKDEENAKNFCEKMGVNYIYEESKLI